MSGSFGLSAYGLLRSLYQAIERGQNVKVVTILKNKKITGLKDKKYKAMRLAIIAGDMDIIRLLVKNNGAPDAKHRKERRHQLYLAGLNANIPLVRYLLSIYASPLVSDDKASSEEYNSTLSGLINGYDWLTRSCGTEEEKKAVMSMAHELLDLKHVDPSYDNNQILFTLSVPHCPEKIRVEMIKRIVLDPRTKNIDKIQDSELASLLATDIVVAKHITTKHTLSGNLIKDAFSRVCMHADRLGFSKSKELADFFLKECTKREVHINFDKALKDMWFDNMNRTHQFTSYLISMGADPSIPVQQGEPINGEIVWKTVNSNELLICASKFNWSFDKLSGKYLTFFKSLLDDTRVDVTIKNNLPIRTLLTSTAPEVSRYRVKYNGFCIEWLRLMLSHPKVDPGALKKHEMKLLLIFDYISAIRILFRDQRFVQKMTPEKLKDWYQMLLGLTKTHNVTKAMIKEWLELAKRMGVKLEK